MKKQLLMSIPFIILLVCTHMQSRTSVERKVDPKKSFVTASASHVSPNPMFVGMIRKKSGAPAKNITATLYIDGIPVARLLTDKKLGTFKYTLRSDRALTEGVHTVYVVTDDLEYIEGRKFIVINSLRELSSTTRSGNVSAVTSLIAFPIQSMITHDSTPSIICVLLDSSDTPVASETMILTIDSNQVTNSVQSNTNGMVMYGLTAGQALSEGSHIVYAHAQESNVDLNSVSFTVDLTPPAAPVITSPTENQNINASTVIVTGTAEVGSLVTVFRDDVEYGEITFSDENGNWTIELSGFEEGEHSIYANQEDAAGNLGPNSSSVIFEITIP